MASVKVAVRVRPLNKREIGMNAKCVINMDNKRTTIINLKNVSNDEEISKEHVKDFFFDYSYWSCDENARNYSGQSVVYNDLGTGVVKAADEGYNACIFAYGQTGSGKTHTMMGQQGNEGLIPRICENLFRQMHQKEDEGVSFRIEVSYLEIYNEKVRDLLRAHQPKAGQPLHTMKVREHPKEGPYVQGLTKHLVGDYNAIEAIMKQGNELRTTASTNMNDTSSRSHAIFTIRYTQAKFLHDMPSETTSKINLVDLAGSERADSTGATGVRLKEGANINKSLVTLGSVISSLAEASTSTGKKGHVFVPYRDSVLTWLLKDSLGGNSKTIMIAAISPADVNYSETLSTLRYANRAKNIINKPTVNEDTNVKLIRDLRAEIDKLKSIIGQEVLCDADKAAARKLFENEERLGALTDKWKDRWKETQKIMQDRSLAFQHRLDAGIRMESELPHLVAMEEDLLSTGILLYHLKEGKTFVGTENSKTKPDIVVSGASILDEHCVIENNEGIVVFEPFPEALCSVNGVTVNKRTRLQQGDVVILGKTNIFRFNHPKEAEELREKRKSVGPGFGNLAMSTQFRSETDLLKKMRTSTVEKEKREEHLSKQLKEARLLLEKQKQEEERRMEEARNEFARQIREESRRLQETRGELQGRLQAKLHEGLSLTELKKHLWDLEKEHDEAEVRRRNREKELSESLQEKAELIGEQRNSLDDIQEKYNQIKDDNNARLLRETRDFVARRSEQVRDVDAEIRHYVCEKEDRDVEHLRAVWLGETKKVSEQELLCEGLQDQLNSVQNTLQNNDNLSDEHKIELDVKTKNLQAEISNAQAHLEELCHYKVKALRKYEQDVENRYEFLTWEREDLEGKKNSKKALLDADMNKLNDCLVEAQSNFDEVKANYYIAEAKENKKMAGERYKVDQLKKMAIKRTIDDQRGFNEKVARYRSLLKTGQDRIDKKKQQTETLRRELTTVMQQQRSEAGRLRAEELRVELNDTIEDVHEMERNHAVMKSEEEKVIENLLNELNAKKAQNERDSEMSQKVLQDLEGVSQKRLLTLQEEVACAENRVDHINTEQQKLEERTKFTAKCHEEATAKLDADLLYIAYLVEKQWDGKGENGKGERGKIHAAKVVLEESTQSYRKNVEEIESESKRLWKPLVEAREQAQIVFEDLTRARDITQMTLQELNEQFAVERKNEKEQMDQIREKMVELQRTRKEEVAEAVHNSSMVSLPPDFNIEDVLVRQKQQIEDEMYEKIITMERVMQQEVEELKTREMKLIACLQKDREKLLTEKETLEKNKEEEDERSGDCARVLKEKEAELEATRGLASKEIQHLHNQLTEANNEIAVLQEKLDKYMSANSLVSSQMEDEGDLSDEEVSQLLIRVNQSEGFDEEDALIARLHETPPSPPPTPVHRFLQSVNIYRKNQIQVTVPRYILRGVGKGSYHVFEVKLGLGGDQWTVYRRYRRFRDLHIQMMKKHPVVASLEFPGRRLFGNRSEGFVRVRRAQLEIYMIALLAVLSNDTECRIYAITDRTLTKQDLALLHPFFKQGVYEANRSDTIHHSPAARRTLSYHKPTP